MQKPLLTDRWQQADSLVEFFAARKSPDDLPITAVKIFSIINDTILMVKTSKGWDIPGGHVAENETPMIALRREVIEETGGCIISSRQVGYLKVTYQGKLSISSYYPDVSVILLYIGEVDCIELDSAMLGYETNEVKYLPIANLTNQIPTWNKFNQGVVDYMREIQS
jgi:8-oxo-dGTP pyrophosphatase MutT (NUDIX family)